MDPSRTAGGEKVELSPDHRWALPPLLRIRTTGFPAELLDDLCAPELAAKLDASADATSAGALREAIERHVESGVQLLSKLQADTRFVEAIWMQARNLAVHLMEGGATSQLEVEDALVFYLQRLAADPETRGFYGPYCWATLSPDATSLLSCTPGKNLVQRNLLSFEHRPIFQLARLIAADPAVQAELRPALNPACELNGSILRYPVARSVELDPAQLCLLRHADGTRTAEQLVSSLAKAAEFAPEGRTAVEALVRDFIDRRILYSSLPLPVGPFPERRLLSQVEALPLRCGSRERWLFVARQFAGWAEKYAQAPFAERRTLATQMEKRFEELTNISVAPLPEDLYRANNLYFEDCARDAQCELGRPFVDRCRELEPYLELARWISLELPRRYEVQFVEVWERLTLDGSLRSVDLVQFARETSWIGQNEAVEESLRRQLREAWSTVLGDRLTEDQASVELTAADFNAVLELLQREPSRSDGQDAFGAQFQTLDVAFGARDLSALRSADAQLIVTELHKSSCLATQLADQPFCPDPRALDAFVAEHVTGEAIQLTAAPEAYQRFDPLWPNASGFFEVLTEGATPRYPAERVIPIGTLEVVQQDGSLFIRSRQQPDEVTGWWYFSVMTGFTQRRLTLVDPLQLGTRHNPRVTLGPNTVLSRRRWTVEGDALPEQLRPEMDPTELWLTVRRLRAKHQWPERCQVKAPSGPRPVVIDFRSFHGSRLFARHIAEAREFTLTELPADPWLPDAAGQRYFSEVRITLATKRS